MTLPYPNITPIPDTEPDAVPSLWNTRYDEIDENFTDLDTRVDSAETEIQEARGEETSLDARLTEIETNVEGLDPDFQNNQVATVLAAMDAAGLANREIQRLTTARIQEGEITIYNRGVISGCLAVKSTEATRNLSISNGRFFAHGRWYGANGMVNTAAVPSNNTDSEAVCYAYLWIDAGGLVRCDCTELDESIPDNGLEIARLTVPAGNTEATDPYLESVTLTDTRRLEPSWPRVQVDPPFAYIELENVMSETDYQVNAEVLTVEGGRSQLDGLFVEDRLINGFKLYLSGAADTVKVLYTASRLAL